MSADYRRSPEYTELYRKAMQELAEEQWVRAIDTILTGVFGKRDETHRSGFVKISNILAADRDRIPEVLAFLEGKEKAAPSNDEAAEALLSNQELKVAWIKAFVDVTNLGKLPDDPRQRAAVVQILFAAEELDQIEQDRRESSE
ncbi:MAG: hypothetical protein O7G87_08185 [bacterium]|nr:hypothetical protein [bacterium]